MDIMRYIAGVGVGPYAEEIERQLSAGREQHEQIVMYRLLFASIVCLIAAVLLTILVIWSIKRGRK